MIKQVIVMRYKYPDGKGGTRSVRLGKSISQGCHASIAFLINIIDKKLPISDNVKNWLYGMGTKICLRVDTEEDLLAIHKKAKSEGLESHLIQDLGFTEFSEPTYTCVAIGPDDSDKIDAVTGHLKLL